MEESIESAVAQAPEIFDNARGRYRRTLVRESRAKHFVRAGLVGVVAALVAVIFRAALVQLEDWRIELLSAVRIWGGFTWVLIPLGAMILAALAGWLTERFAPEAAGSGIPHVKGALLRLRTIKWKTLVPVKCVAGLLAIGGGLSLGREGPTIQMGAGVGQAAADLLKVPKKSGHYMIAGGAGAGLAAAFNAPLAGFIFVIEELERQLSPLTYGTAFTAALCGDIVMRICLGQSPAFRISNFAMPPLSALPLFVLVGILCGVLGILFTKGLVGLVILSMKHPEIARWKKAMAVGALAGLMMLVIPEAAGSGYHASIEILDGRYGSVHFVPFLLCVFSAKFLLTLLSYASGVPGGIFAPMLLLGSIVGLLVGAGATALLPSIASVPAAFAVSGMAAFLSSVVRTPLTAIVLTLEMTANYEQLLPLSVACMIAYFVAERARVKPIYEILLDIDLRASRNRITESQEPIFCDLVVEPESLMDGCRISDIDMPTGCLFVIIKRSGREIVPRGQTVLFPGDEITCVLNGNIGELKRKISAFAQAGY